LEAWHVKSLVEFEPSSNLNNLSKLGSSSSSYFIYSS